MTQVAATRSKAGPEGHNLSDQQTDLLMELEPNVSSWQRHVVRETAANPNEKAAQGATCYAVSGWRSVSAVNREVYFRIRQSSR
jgi:hypothetical protein